MNQFIRKNFFVILAFLLPFLLIIGFAASVYLPSAFLSTNYNFLYSLCSINNNYSYNCNNYLPHYYSVVNGKLVVNQIDPSLDSDKDGVADVNENYGARIFLHDTKKNESKEITFSEAQSLRLDGLLTSPDGVSVTSDWQGGAEFFPFFDSGSSYGHYLVKGKSKSQLNLINNADRYYYRNNFRFIGWVLP